MIMMPYAWILDIAAAHRPGRLLAPHRSPSPETRQIQGARWIVGGDLFVLFLAVGWRNAARVPSSGPPTY